MRDWLALRRSTSNTFSPGQAFAGYVRSMPPNAVTVEYSCLGARSAYCTKTLFGGGDPSELDEAATPWEW